MNYTRIKPLLIPLFIFLAFACSSEFDTSLQHKLFTPEELRNDLNYLVEQLEKRHVDFYNRANPDSIQKWHQRLSDQLNRPMTRKAFFLIAGLLNPYYKDAHCLLFPLRDEANNDRDNGHQLFPIYVTMDANGLVHPERDYQRKTDGIMLEKGNAITSINQIPIQEIIKQISRYSHGETVQLQRYMTTLLFSDWLYTIYGWKDEFKLSMMDGTRVDIHQEDEWISLEKNNQGFNSLTLMNDIAYLKLNSFDVDEEEDAYEKFIEESFKSIKDAKINKLVIDVRGNTGGQSDAGAKVIQYLIKEPVTQVSLAFERIHEGNSGFLDFRGKPGTLKELEVAHDDLIEPVNREKQFDGQVVVLSDELTYSAGIIFITIMQDHGLATLIGRPTGGFANQTGNMETFELPNTKLTVYAPARTFVRVNKNESVHPVTPDVVVWPDSLPETDEVLAKAIEILR